MSHIALYRAWRPQTFDSMVGQQHIVQTLQNAIREQRISHAYLFNGPRGTGKTTAAKVMAKAINCEQGPAVEPCNTCIACRGISAGTVMDVVEIDAASNRGIDEIRDIRDKVRYAPSEVRYKVYIIDEVHMLTAEAFNALLKTLEEPPGHVVFILATTEPHKLPATIISRCQRFDFRQVSLEQQSLRLRQICDEEGIRAEDEALTYIARLSDGGMRDAISLLEQASAFTGGSITLEGAIDVTGGMASEHFAQLAEAIQARDVGAVIPIVERLMQAGKSADKCMENLIYYFRDLLLLQLAPDSAALTERIVDAGRFQAMAEGFPRERLFMMVDTLNQYQVEMRHAAQPQTIFEVALMKICTMDGGAPAGQRESAAQRPAEAAAAPNEREARLAARIDELERKLEQLLRTGVAAGGGEGAAQAASAAAQPATRPGGGRRGGSGFGGGGGAGGGIRTVVKLGPYLQAKSSPQSMQVRQRWGEVLHKVKEARISVHAWLIDGEPVAVHESMVLIAFKNTMHRETTEKQANREVIERVMAEVFGRQVSFATVMQKEWQASADNEAEQEPEELDLQVPADGQGQAAAGSAGAGRQARSAPPEPANPPWVEEAYKLFGTELVKVVDDDGQS